MSHLQSTPRTQVKRIPKRGVYDREAIYSILDEALICHVGFTLPEDAGGPAQPFVIPTGFARCGDTLYVHGSAASRMLKALSGGIPACVTVTLMDGLVLARAAFHHSMNYRSVVMLGIARLVEDAEEKLAALEAFTNHMMPGRWSDVRKPNESELKATSVLALSLDEVSAKVRTGPPIDEDEDYQLPIWAGVLPLRLAASDAETDPRCLPGLEPPASVRATRPGR
jgi:nitroimidazol reductase NimA-like FMN-containing flavoprotein (pyridoxamine 5'-phosphate oxidase superfamily)